MALLTDTPTGLFGVVRRFGDTILSLIQNRIELLAVEFREEKGRVVAMLGWSAAVLFFAFMAVITITALCVAAFWQNAVAVLAGFSVFYLVAAIGCFIALRGRIKRPPFAETIHQFKRDRQWLAKD